MKKTHIRISLGAKFQPKLTLDFWTKHAQKAYFPSKTKKSQFCVHTWSLLTVLMTSIQCKSNICNIKIKAAKY